MRYEVNLDIFNAISTDKGVLRKFIYYCPDEYFLFEIQAVIQNLTLDNIKASVERKETVADVMWLNIVWSMTILNKAPHKYVESVLSNDFFNRILCKFSY